MTGEPLRSSFRDPAGFVFEGPSGLRRAVTARGRDDYEAFMASGLYAGLTGRGQLVSHTEEPADEARLHKVLAPEKIPVISYPYEWSFPQLRDAALLTLEIQAAALERGMSLKDATPYNVQFFGSRPVFIDTLSFERLEEKPWAAYRQFCETFLAPLALMAAVSPDFNKYLGTDLNGFELSFASRLLPRRTWMSAGQLIHLHLHAAAQRRWRGGGSAEAGTMSRASLLGLVKSLEGAVEGLRAAARVQTAWQDYYGQCAHYPAEAEAFKMAVVAEWTKRLSPRRVLDLGANDGRYSRPAAELGATSVCVDADAACVEKNYLSAKARQDASTLALRVDLANPSAGAGWEGTERPGLFERVRPDLTLCLALLHHLRIGLQIPPARLAAFLARAGGDLVLEFVPLADPMAQKLLRGRGRDFEDLEESVFDAHLSRHFTLAERRPVPGTARTLSLWKTRAA